MPWSVRRARGLGLLTDVIFVAAPSAAVEHSRVDAGLYGLPVRSPLDAVRRDAGPVGNGLDELGPVVHEAHAVVRRVGRGQRAVGDERVQQRAALLLAVVVHAV